MREEEGTMNNAEKIPTQENVQKLKKKYIQNGTIIVVTAVVLMFVLRSIAWFVQNDNVEADSMSVKLRESAFELEAIDRSDRVFSTVSGAALSVINDDMEADEYYYYKPDHPDTTDQYPGLFWRLADEDPLNETNLTSEPWLYPGSYGTISFYIVPKDVNEKLNITFLFDLKGIEAAGVDPAGEEYTEALDYLKGHILFFKNRSLSNGKFYYSDRIDTDDSFVYDTDDHQSDKTNGKYLVQLYWIWPKTFGQIAKEAGNGRHDILFNTAADRNEIVSYMADNPGFFFRNVSSEDAVAMLGSYNNNNNSYVGLSDGYNNADQLIGEKIRYLIAGLIADE